MHWAAVDMGNLLVFGRSAAGTPALLLLRALTGVPQLVPQSRAIFNDATIIAGLKLLCPGHPRGDWPITERTLKPLGLAGIKPLA